MLLITYPGTPAISLLSGDRFQLVQDGTSAAAFRKGGVPLISVSKAMYNLLASKFTPEGNLDSTGKLAASAVPTWLTQAALDTSYKITGSDGKVTDAHLPDRLSVASLNALLSSGSGSSVGNQTVTGTATITNAVISTSNVTTLTAGTATVSGTLNVNKAVYKPQAQPAASATGVVQYVDSNNRIAWVDQLGNSRRASGKLFVTTWPANADSVLGDEAINTITGEHRVYLGTALGWRLATNYSVATLTDRDALTNLYPGMRVFVSDGLVPQDHVYGEDGKWHGTLAYSVNATADITPQTGINDTNWRRWANTLIADPGFDYYVRAEVGLSVIAAAGTSANRSWVNLSSWADQTNDVGQVMYRASLQDTHNGGVDYRMNHDISGTTPQLTGPGRFSVDWHLNQNFLNASTATDEYTLTYTVFPA